VESPFKAVLLCVMQLRFDVRVSHTSDRDSIKQNNLLNQLMSIIIEFKINPSIAKKASYVDRSTAM